MPQNSVGYSVRIDGLEELQAALRKAPKIAEKHIQNSMERSVKQVESEVKPLTPVFQGRLRGSIASEVQGSGSKIIGLVGSSLKDEEYPAVMEFGRRPGAKMPPPSALERWVQLVLKVPAPRSKGVAFVVARSIAKKGIKGKKFLKRGFEKSLPNVKKNFANALEDIVKEIARRA